MTKEATPEQVVEFMTNVMNTTPEQTITMLRAEIERLKAERNELYKDRSRSVLEIERLKQIEIKYDQLISGAFP